MLRLPLLSSVALVLMLLFAWPAAAETPSAAPAGETVKVDELERLVSTLEDDKARAQMVGQLRTLIAARRAVGAPADQGVVAGLSEAIGSVGQDALAGVSALKDVPVQGERLLAWMNDPATRAESGRSLLHLLVVLVAGLAAEHLVRRALARTTGAIAPAVETTVLVRLPLALLRGVAGLGPIAAFAAAGSGLEMLLHLDGGTQVAASTAVAAWVAFRLVLVAADVLVAPGAPTLRLLPVGDKAAKRLVCGTARLAGLGLFGGFALETARSLGLPAQLHLLAAKALGLAVAGLVLLAIIRNRRPVAAFIHGLSAGLGPRMQALAGRLADIWHVPATLYVAAVFLAWALPMRGDVGALLRATVLTVLILAVARGVSGLLRKAVDRSRVAGRSLAALHAILHLAIAAAAAVALLQAWGVDALAWVTSDVGRRLMASAISIATVLLGAVVVWEVVSGAIERYLTAADRDGSPLQRSARVRTLLPLARNALFVVMLVMVVLIVLSELGVNIAPLLAGAGMIGIAVGLGSQKLVQDVIAGAFILFEDTIAVGDVVDLGGNHSGLVEALSIRAIRLRDFSGRVHTIPFGSVGSVINMNRDFGYAVFEVGIAYGEDTDRVTAVLTALGGELAADPDFGPRILAPLEMVGVDRFDASAVILKARFKTRPLQQWAVAREFNRRLKKRFDAEGIEIPFPQSTVWFGDAKTAAALKGVALAD